MSSRRSHAKAKSLPLAALDWILGDEKAFEKRLTLLEAQSSPSRKKTRPQLITNVPPPPAPPCTHLHPCAKPISEPCTVRTNVEMEATIKKKITKKPLTPLTDFAALHQTQRMQTMWERALSNENAVISRSSGPAPAGGFGRTRGSITGGCLTGVTWE